jgi:DNA-binding IclR family transcriptional regulator
MNSPSGETSQTLDRGLTVLALLAAHSEGLTAAELAEGLSTARAVVYRLLRTLEAHRLVGRMDTRYVLGIGIAELASKLRPQLQATVLPILRRLSEETNSTTLLSIADGDQALILLTEEPTRSLFHLALRQGARHPLDVGADGLAILAGRPPAPGPPTGRRPASASSSSASTSRTRTSPSWSPRRPPKRPGGSPATSPRRLPRSPSQPQAS